MKKTNTTTRIKTVFDDVNPEWTKARIQKAVPFSGLPENVQNILRGVQARRRTQAAAKKVPVSIRLSADVVEGLRATGDGWQVRADEVLRSWLVSGATDR